MSAASAMKYRVKESFFGSSRDEDIVDELPNPKKATVHGNEESGFSSEAKERSLWAAVLILACAVAFSAGRKTAHTSGC